MDSDGYPTDAELEKIRRCKYEETNDVLEFVASIWRWPESGVAREDGVLYLATGGWSGNEAIIQSMHENLCLWSRWICSTRGGAHEFYLAAGWRSHHESRFMLARKVRGLTADLEQGFVPGTYVRLKALHAAERQVSTLEGELATVNERLRLAHRDVMILQRQNRQEESVTVRQLRQDLDKYLKLEVPHVL